METFLRQCIVAYPPGEPNPVIAKARRIQEDYVQVLTRDDGTTKNISLIDKDKIHRNSLQVIKQYTVSSGTRTNRYDVTILVNGLPLVHVELKRRGVKLREASTKLTATTANPSTPKAATGYLSTYSYSSSPTAPKPSTTQTPPGSATPKTAGKHVAAK